MRSCCYTIVVCKEVKYSEGIEQVASPDVPLALSIVQVEVDKYADVPGLDVDDTEAFALPLIRVNISSWIGLYILRIRSRLPRWIPVTTLTKYLSNVSNIF